MGRSVSVEALESRTLLSRAVGIDVASFQGSPTWSSVYSSGVQFAYVKATQGNYYVDPDYAPDVAKATAASVVVGAYDFADYTVNPTTEANYFLATARNQVSAGYLRPMLDLEASTSDTQAQVSSWVNTWCNTVYSSTGVKPVLYVSGSYAQTYLNSTVTQWALWAASWNGQNAQTGGPSSTTPWSTWSLWQYTDAGSVGGISGNVDMDVANGDMTTYVIPQLVGGSTQFTTGQVVHVNTTSGLKAWNTYASNGTVVVEPNNTNGIIKGGPVYVAGYLRWPIQYAGSSTTTWSAGSYLSAGGVPTVTAFTASPNPVYAGSNFELSATVSDPESTVKSVSFYRESNGTSGLQTGTGGDTLVGTTTTRDSGGRWSLFNVPASSLTGNYTYYALPTDTSGIAGTAVSVSVTVSPQPVTVTLSGTGANPSDATQSLDFMATVSGGVPDGETVLLKDASNNNAVVATGAMSSGVAKLNVPAGALLAGTHDLIAVYNGDATFAPGQSAALAQSVQVAVADVVVNGNLAALAGAQRSMVDSIVYSFSERVNVATSDAFSIAVHSGQPGTAPTLGWAAINPASDGSSTQWAVTFSGAGVNGGSIADGAYDITLNPTVVTSDHNPAIAAQARATDTFYRLFGDVTGTQRVNNVDYNLMLGAYNLKSGQSGYLAALDASGTGSKIGNADYNAFLANYNQRLSGFTPTI